MDYRIAAEQLAPMLGLSPDAIGDALELVGRCVHKAAGSDDESAREVTLVLKKNRTRLLELCGDSPHSIETVAAALVTGHKAVHMDAGEIAQEMRDQAHFAGVYEGRIIYELLQNIHDAIARVKDLPPIGRFGLGVKSLACLVDAILLRSGPFSLRFEPDLVKSLRPDGHSLTGFPLLPFPLPLPPDRRLPDLPAGNAPGIGTVRWEGRTWLWSRHQGLAFSPEDLDGFRRRHFSGKTVDQRSIHDDGDTVLLFRLSEADDSRATKTIRASMCELDSSILMFLPGLDALLVDDGEHLRELRLEFEGRHGRMDLLRASPENRLWLRSTTGELGFACPIPKGRMARSYPLTSWFPVTEVIPGLPFKLHDRELELKDNRKSLEETQHNLRRLKALGKWAAGRAGDTAAACRRGPLVTQLVPLADRLPRALMPRAPRTSAATSTGNAEQLASSSEAADLLRSSFVEAFRTNSKPIFSTEQGPHAAKEALWVPPGKEADARKCRDELERASGGRVVLREGINKWLEDSHISPLYPLVTDEPESTLFPQLAKLEPEWVSGALTCLGEGLDRRKRLLHGELVPVYRSDKEHGAVTSLYRLLDGEEDVPFDGHVAVPVTRDSPGDHAVRGLVLTGERQRNDSVPLDRKGVRFLERMGYLVVDSSVGALAGAQLVALGAREPRREEILENLAEEAEKLPHLPIEGAKARAREAWSLACDLVTDMVGHDVREYSHPLTSVVALYGKLRVDCFVRDSKTILSREEMRLVKERLALSRLAVTTLAGTLRAVSELSISTDNGLPAHLQADVPAVADWMGTKDCDGARRKLLQFGAWKTAPILVRCRRLDPHPDQDELFDRFWRDYQPPKSWLRMIPATKEGDHRRTIEGQYRLPVRWDAHHARPLHNDDDAWHWCAGHRVGDKVAVVVDAPPELCSTEGLRRPRYAELMAESFAQHAIADDSPLGWSWFVALEGWRGHYRRWAGRVSCRGALPSPLLHRLRNSRWLKPDKRAARSWSTEPPGRIAPIVATTWQRQQLEQRPWRFLPIAELDEEMARLLCVAAPPADVSQAGVHPADPRWVLATLFRLSCKWKETSEGRPDVKQMKALCARLLQHLAHALGITGQPRSTSFPKAGETWGSHYRASTRCQDGSEFATLAGWIRDMVQAGFLDEPKVAGMLPAAHRSEPLGVVGSIPMFVIRGREGRFESLDEIWTEPPGVVGVEQPADVERRIGDTLGLIAFPRDLVSFSRFLRLPLFALGQPRKPSSVPPPSWAGHLETVVRRALPWLIRAAVEAGPRVDEDALSLRMSEGLRWRYVKSLLHNVPVLGLPNGKWSSHEYVPFRCLVRAAEPRQKKRRTVSLVGVVAGMTEGELRTRFVELAQPLAEAMGLVGSGTRLAMEYVLHRCAEPLTWRALGRPTEPLPTTLRTFLATRGWLQEGGAEGVGALHRRLNRFLSTAGLEPLAPLALTQDETDARPMLQRVLRARWPEVPQIAIRNLSTVELETDEVPARCLAWVQHAAGLTADQTTDSLRHTGVRLRTLIDGSSLDKAWSSVRRLCEPAVEQLLESGHLLNNPLATTKPGFLLLKDQADVNQRAGQLTCAGIRNRSLREGLLQAFNQQDLESALDHALEHAGLTPPGRELRERAAWKSLLVDAARILQGSAALATLENSRSEPLDVRFDQWRRNPAWAASRLLDWAAEMVPRSTAGLARLLGLEHPANDARLDSGSQLAETAASWAQEQCPEAYARLVAQSGRTVTMLGRDFLTERHAEDALESRRDELEAHEPEVVEVNLALSVTDAEGSTRVSSGRGGMRFSARAGLVGREGERYLLARLQAGKCMPCPGEIVLALDVRNAQKAAEARTDSRVGAWLDGRAVTNWPGFDILVCYSSEGREQWDGVEVKSSVQPLGDTVEINWTENELRAARKTAEQGWPIDTYRICCVTRLWSLEDDLILPPQIAWFSNPWGLVETDKAHLETTTIRHTLRLCLK